MFRLIRRSWKYTVALLGRRFEDVADPEIQIEQAIEEGKWQHQLLVEQAAAVIGNQHELELKLGRTIDQVEALRGSARESLRLADDARLNGDEGATASYEDSARSFALALVSSEAEMRDLKVLHDHSVDGAAAAKAAVETNALEVRQRLAERTRLLSQLEQTKMQERMNAALGSMSALAPASDVPSFDRIREKIERRYSQALGMAEVGSTTIEVRSLNVRKATLDADAARQLAALRASLSEPSPLGGDTA